MDTLRLGFIGAGGNARNAHAKPLARRDDVAIVAIADPSEQARERFVAEALVGADPPAQYADHADMLEGEQLDAVVVSTPHTLHFRQIMDALDAGLHVLAEKPMVCSTDEAERVMERAAAAGKHIVVSYQRRFQARFRYMKQFINDPVFGRLHLLAAFQSQSWWTGQEGRWRQQPELSGGGQLNDSGSHVVDVIMWMLPDPVVQVAAMIENRGRDVDIDSVVSFRTAGGTLGSVTLLGSAMHKGMCEDITISGDGGRCLFVRRDGGEPVLRATRQFGQPLEDIVDLGDCKDEDPNDHFIDVIRGRAENKSTPGSFLNVIRFTEACWRSAAAGGRPMALA